MYLQDEDSVQSIVNKEDKGSNAKKKGSTKKLIDQPGDSNKQQFLYKYLAERGKGMLFNDDKLVEDIDDLSDMDKVSLISDI